MRTLDIGGDKDLPYSLLRKKIPSLDGEVLEFHWIIQKFSLVQILEAAGASEGLGHLRIMLPMISNVPELDDALESLKESP